MTSPADFIQAAATAALAVYAKGIQGNSETSTIPPGPVGTFAHASYVQAGLMANSAPMPFIVLFDYTSNQKTTTAKVERADCTLYFCDKKLGQGDDPAREAATVLRMEILKARFFAALDVSPLVEISSIRATPFHNNFEAELTGVGVMFTLGVPAAALC